MITFLGDVALISDDLKSRYKPQNSYVFNCEYVIGNKDVFSPTLHKINLCANKDNFSEIFGCNPIAVSIVNNHIYDYGEEGFKSTIDNLKSRKIGIVDNNPFYVNDKVCLLAYMDLGKSAKFNFDYDVVKNDINKVKKDNASVKIVVQMHWGTENHPSINDRQEEIGHWLIDQGVDLIIGHHPHCIQPIEEYKGKYICYSLGNGLFGNINQPSHYDNNGIAKRTYRFKWQRWNRKSFAINYDEENDAISIDELYQKRNILLCKKQNINIRKHSNVNRQKKLTYIFRKYALFFVSNMFVDGKIFDVDSLKHELRKK